MDSSQAWSELLPYLVGGGVSLLLGVNGYFIKRLVDEITSVNETVKTQFPLQQAKVDGFAVQLEDLKIEMRRVMDDFRSLVTLKERVAVLESFQYRDRSREEG